MLINRRHVQIEWGDCDAAGTVFFPRYLEYGDACTNALFKLAGLFKPVMIKTYNIIGIPLVDLRARFVVPSDFGDEVVYETSITEWGRTSFLVQHRVFLPDGVLGLEIFEARMGQACKRSPGHVSERADSRRSKEEIHRPGSDARHCLNREVPLSSSGALEDLTIYKIIQA